MDICAKKRGPQRRQGCPSVETTQPRPSIFDDITMDRLAAMRVSVHFSSSSTPTDRNPTLYRPNRAGEHDAPSHSRGHTSDDLHPHSQYRANPYARQDDSAYEMSEVRDSTTNLTADGGGGRVDAGDTMGAFYAEVRMLSSMHA